MTDPRRRDVRAPQPKALRNALIAGVAVLAVVAVVLVVLLLAPRGNPSPTPTGSASRTPTPNPTPTPTPTPTFDKTRFSVTDPNSDWVIVNKKNPLNPKDYAPTLAALGLPGYKGQMRPEAAAALQKMFGDYQAQNGAQLTVVSPYRSYGDQVSVYNGWVSRLGQAQADRQSARPGYSEHQTGLAVDINTAQDQGFGNTQAGKWLAANSWQYGFILRYPDGLESVTGYEYEPWHFRYVGVELATEMHNTGVQTLEQFFGYPDAPDY
ncbi:MAG TPA: M15 family metallopeptidase [Pseudolysinimonas sp.]|nr:M15 family metallopeptidase [Pseudolysinimonas sp.]